MYNVLHLINFDLLHLLNSHVSYYIVVDVFFVFVLNILLSNKLFKYNYSQMIKPDCMIIGGIALINFSEILRWPIM